MDWKALANTAISMLAAFTAGFFAVPLVVGGDVPLKVQLAAGFSSGMAAVIQHFRQPPGTPKAS